MNETRSGLQHGSTASVSRLFFILIPLAFLCTSSCNRPGSQDGATRYHHIDMKEFTNVPIRHTTVEEDIWKAGIIQYFQYYGQVKLARVYEYDGEVYCVAVLDNGSGNSLNYISISRIPDVDGNRTIKIEHLPGWIGQDNFRQKGENIYCYTSEDSVYHFSLTDGGLVRDEQYPFERIDYVNGSTSPDGKFMACWSNIDLYLENSEHGDKEQLWHEKYEGDWSIGEVVWSPDGKKLYFDNTGPVACIWQYDLEHNILKKVVPDDEAIHPSVFNRNGFDYVCYVQGNSVRFATSDPDAPGLFDPAFLSEHSIDLPLSIRESTTDPEILDVILFKGTWKTVSWNNAGEEDMEEIKTVVKLGTVTSGPYRAGILYRMETYDAYKGGSEFFTDRFIRINDSLILLPRSSSDKSVYKGTSYKIYLSDRTYRTELFSNCSHVVCDYAVAVDGIQVPKILQEEPGSYSVTLVKEAVFEDASKNVPARINDAAGLKQQLDSLYRDERLGVVFVEKDPGLTDKHEGLKYCGGGLFSFTSDGSMLVYKVTPEFSTLIEGRRIEQNQGYAYVTDAGYTENDGSGDLDLACIYTAKELEKEIMPVGSTDAGEPIWGFISPDSKVLRQEYNRIKKSFDEISSAGIEPLPDFETFVSSMPVYFWKDPFGRYFRFLKREYLTPQLAEPIIYLYDDSERTVSIATAGKVEVTQSFPQMGNGWTVRGSASGRVIETGSGRQFDHLFWEGYAGFLPHPTTGFVVRREELPAFFDSKLKELGLVDREITEFKEAWLDDLTGAPWYLISFYNRDLVDRYAPLHVDPEPETVIRVLMDYRPLEKRITVPEPVLPAPLPRKGLTLVEWGGLKR